jgi:hypothetical protein
MDPKFKDSGTGSKTIGDSSSLKKKYGTVPMVEFSMNDHSADPK